MSGHNLPMQENTLILGLAAGYHYGDVRPFLESLNQSDYKGRCVLFTTPTTRGLDAMRAHGCEVIPFERPDEMQHVPYNAWRYFLYRDYLRDHPPFERILLSDVRDVVFQRHPFSFDWPDGLNVIMEDASTTIGACEYMTRWVSGHLGEDAWKALRDRPVSCSGTTIGDHAAMTRYLDTLTDRLLPFTPGDRMAGYDQGLHNFLLHNGLLDLVTRHDNSGPVLTLAAKPGTPEPNEKGEIPTDAGEIAHMVHQYDRKPELFKMIREKYAPKS